MKQTIILSAAVLAGPLIALGMYLLPAPRHPKTVEPVIRAQDTVTCELRGTLLQVDKEKDSIVRNGRSLYAYHDGRIVAARPNKTWDWIVLDSVGWRICIAKSKRRDRL